VLRLLRLVHSGGHVFEMAAPASPRLVHRTAMVRLRLTRRQAHRCYGLLRSGGDVWAWLLDTNRARWQQGEPAISNYQALCRGLTRMGTFGEQSMVGAVGTASLC
jgi:formylglycine-generating enzyme required for sulfatase activity